ncbi:MAG: endolytic transglycosylase MltG [Hyphomicrobiaceae bacterium]|nr:endolytic transglycosylase MltG [Hyphomicrobiaceae bacterium]
MPHGSGKKAASGRPAASPAVTMEPERVARRAKKALKGPRKEPRFVRLGSALFTVFAASMLGVTWLIASFDYPGPLREAKSFVVPRGEGASDIAERLERDGVIANRWTFMTMTIVNRLAGTAKKGGDLKAGAYEFKPGASMREVADVLIEGKSALLKLTIPEGLTSFQIVERLKANEQLSGEITGIPPEGALLPDTMVIQRGTSRQDLIDRMQAGLQKVLAEEWQKRQPNLPIQTPEQALILASIVEKETGKADERARVAGVFVNRMRKNMRLQSDPTIIYGITQGAGPMGRPIYRSDIDQKTAYNTYQIDGLPPTPIANVGREAIAAVLNPATSNDLYFVADGTGGHTFSETLKDHNAAVANWRRIERETKAAKDAERSQAAAAPAGSAIPLPAAGAPSQGVRINGQFQPAAQSPTGQVSLPLAAEEPATAAEAVSTGDAIPLPVRKPKR